MIHSQHKGKGGMPKKPMTTDRTGRESEKEHKAMMGKGGMPGGKKPKGMGRGKGKATY